jgi:hypothetical protein
LDGVDISDHVTGYDLSHDVGGVPHATLTLIEPEGVTWGGGIEVTCVLHCLVCGAEHVCRHEDADAKAIIETSGMNQDVRTYSTVELLDKES